MFKIFHNNKLFNNTINQDKDVSTNLIQWLNLSRKLLLNTCRKLAKTKSHRRTSFWMKHILIYCIALLQFLTFLIFRFQRTEPSISLINHISFVDLYSYRQYNFAFMSFGIKFIVYRSVIKMFVKSILFIFCIHL